jgi:diguanylate cyclase (GGDEF)-like protein
VLFAVLILALAEQALGQFSGASPVGGGADRIGPAAVAVLLPLNLVGVSLIGERGLVTGLGLTRLALILAQVPVVAFLCRPGQWHVAELLEYRFFAPTLTAWTPLPELSLVAFGAGVALLGVRFLVRRGALERGFLWALVAAFTGLQGSRAGWNSGSFLATAGLILALAVIETSFRIAYHDELTGLPGGRALKEALRRLGSQYAVALVAIDHFKGFNDRYGHAVGDQVLRMVAARLTHVSGEGRAYRYGGAEFAVVFPGQSAKDVIPQLDSLRRAVEASCFVLRGADRPRKKPEKPRPPSGPRTAVLVTVSIGAAGRDETRRRPAHVLKAADQALDHAKAAGRNQANAYRHLPPHDVP